MPIRTRSLFSAFVIKEGSVKTVLQTSNFLSRDFSPSTFLTIYKEAEIKCLVSEELFRNNFPYKRSYKLCQQYEFLRTVAVVCRQQT